MSTSLSSSSKAPVSPSLPDSAIGMDVIHEHPLKTVSSLPTIPERLAHLARLLSSDFDSRIALSPKHRMDIETYVKGIEDIVEPCCDSIQESSSKEQRKTSDADAQLLHKASDESLRAKEVQYHLNQELHIILRRMDMITSEMRRRRAECFHLNSLFEKKCVTLTCHFGELESEIRELLLHRFTEVSGVDKQTDRRSDVHDSAIELEALRGTIHGLAIWIADCKQPERRSKTKPSSGDGKSKRTEMSDRDRNEYDMVMDGLNAWLRGWKDVDEGFRSRARVRHEKARRKRPSSSDNCLQAAIPRTVAI